MIKHKTESKLAEVRIVCAANKCSKTGTIVLGIRHYCPIMKQNMEKYPECDWTTSEQGFVDQYGNFYPREQSYYIAKKNGQIIREIHGVFDKLFSEHLY